MDIETLEQKIDKRARERVQQRIKKFKSGLAAAINELGLGEYHGNSTMLQDFGERGSEDHQAVLRCFGAMLSDNSQTGWPGLLWEKERDLVRNEVLSTMNEMQRMLAAREPSEDDCVPDSDAEKK